MRRGTGEAVAGMAEIGILTVMKRITFGEGVCTNRCT
jgi:hypothetical protein